MWSGMEGKKISRGKCIILSDLSGSVPCETIITSSIQLPLPRQQEGRGLFQCILNKQMRGLFFFCALYLIVLVSR